MLYHQHRSPTTATTNNSKAFWSAARRHLKMTTDIQRQGWSRALTTSRCSWVRETIHHPAWSSTVNRTRTWRISRCTSNSDKLTSWGLFKRRMSSSTMSKLSSLMKTWVMTSSRLSKWWTWASYVIQIHPWWVILTSRSFSTNRRRSSFIVIKTYEPSLRTWEERRMLPRHHSKDHSSAPIANWCLMTTLMLICQTRATWEPRISQVWWTEVRSTQISNARTAIETSTRGLQRDIYPSANTSRTSLSA